MAEYIWWALDVTRELAFKAVVDIIHAQSYKFETNVKINTTAESKFDDCPASVI